MQQSRKVVGLIAAVCLAVVSACGSPQRGYQQEPEVPTAPALKAPTAASEPGPVDDDAPEEFTETDSGLKYRIRRKSDGRKPTGKDTAVVNYRGWLDDGTVFDSSYKHGKPFPANLNGGVIEGWIEGMQLIGEGGMIEIEIPSALGYGPRGSPPDIPPNATLHFLVELIEIK